uniref:Angiotensin-converting enzyme n=1 Tax=Diabrotica virgifera virgifera TaxID=50390 RepID=A0A6P7FKT6_DIAVI
MVWSLEVSELTAILANSRDEKELKHVWVEWRKALSKCKADYIPYVTLSNQAAKLNNFTDNAEVWLLDYEDDTFKDQVQALWEQVKPLYLELHAYVRFKLRQKYGDIVPEKGPIPAHLLGNMWAQAWINIASFTLPYPDVVDYDITAEMLKQNFTAKKIFETAESFFKSINLTAMPDLFWQRSIIEKPKDREIICHASAWDIFDGKDFRIKMCTDVNYEDMDTAHHEMGHIEYFLLYRDQPTPYRTGANNAFHEAVGDLISLSFSSTKHLRKIGLITSKTDNNEQILNNLYKMGLKKIAFLPFGYLIDLWRWDIFAGKTTPENYNCKWWELREKYQGIEPPVDRSEEDFDPAAKYHVVADVSYLRYFISFVIQFQFHKAVCEKAGEYEPNNPKKPLHECDIYQNTDAGNALKFVFKKNRNMCDISVVKKTPFVIIYFVNFHLILAQVSLPPAFIPNDQRRDPYNNNGRGDPYNNDGRGFSSSTPFPPYSSTPFPPRDFPYNPNDPRNDYNQNFGQRPSDLPPSFVSKNNVNNPQNFNNRQGDFSAQRPLNPQNFGGRSFDDDFNRRNRVDGDRDIRGLLQALDIQASQMCTNNVAAQWNFETNINEATQLEAINAQQFYSDFQHGVWDLLNKVGNINSLDPQTFRQIKYYSVIGPSALPPEELDRYNRLINDMLVLYNTGSICAFNDPLHCGLRLQPDLSKIMAKSRNWDELQYVWTEWRRNSGQKMKDSYEQMVKVSNNAARANNFTDTADYWSFPFESPSLMLDMEDAWEEVKPLYELLLTYVRRKLREYYGPEKINRQAPLPAHILGNMWGQSWSNIFDITQPYPGQSFLDVTPEMIKQGYTPPDLFRLAEDFFVSMNMSVLPLEFWQGSVLQEPLDRIVLCQPSAWDFCNRRDFRIKMCTNVNMKDLITAHHEMAHIYYFIQYKNQPKVFRDGANPAFHEAIGEAIGLSVGTPRHLQALGLVQKSIDRVAVDINFLYSMALDKIVFLPFALVMDKWRYDVFKGVVQKEEYNCHWWLLR